MKVTLAQQYEPVQSFDITKDVTCIGEDDDGGGTVDDVVVDIEDDVVVVDIVVGGGTVEDDGGVEDDILIGNFLVKIRYSNITIITTTTATIINAILLVSTIVFRYYGYINI